MKMNELARQRAQMGMVFQSFNLWPHFTALENVIEGLITVKRVAYADAIAFGLEMLAKVGLTGKSQ